MTGTTSIDPSDPLVGWRYWLVNEEGRLSSVAYRRFEWEPTRPLRAVCVSGGHAAPQPRCGCGIYGAPDLETLRRYGLCLGLDPVVVGEATLWGEVVEAGREWRAAEASPRRLWLVRDTAPVEHRDGLRAALAAYDVPVGEVDLADVVGEVAAAVRANLELSSRTDR